MFQQPQRQTARQLLKAQKIAIPVYQRGYAWSDDEVGDYIGDVEDLCSGRAIADREHFLGMMLCYSRADEKWGHVLEVIDGQQRLTTTSILVLTILAAVESIARSPELGESTTRAAGDLKRVLESLLMAGDEPKLSLNDRDHDEWKRMVAERSALPDEKLKTSSISIQNLNLAFAELQKRLVLPKVEVETDAQAEKSIADLEALAKTVLDGLSVVLLTADSEKAVYDLFMIINDRGKPLSPLDLIRTGTLSKLKRQKDKFDKAKLYFAPLLDVDEDEARRCLTHYVNSHAGARVAKSALLKRLSSWLYRDDTKPEFETLLLDRIKRLSEGTEYLIELTKKKPDWLGAAYPFAADAIGAERQHRLLAALKHESAKPLLVAGAEMLDATKFRALLGVLERIAMRAFVTQKVHKSTLADFHIEQASRMRNSPEAWSPAQMWTDALASDLGPNRKTIALADNCPDNLFIEGVKSLEWRNSRGLIAYLLLGIEAFDFHEKRPGTEQTFHWGQIHLDHIVPQSSADDSVVQAAIEHRLGNLTPLSGRKNSKLKDMPFGVEKAKEYKTSKVLMTRQIGLDYEQWGVEDVNRRTNELANKACLVWNLDPTSWI